MSGEHERDELLEDAYLWDRSDPLDEDIAELEDVLGVLRSDKPMPALDPPESPARPHLGWWLAVAAGVALVIGGWLSREGAELTPPVAHMAIPSVDVPGRIHGGGPSATPADGYAWEVTTVSGTPICDGNPIAQRGTLRVGAWVETDEQSRARVAVAGIGTLDLGPGTRLLLVATAENEHRVQLEKGHMRVAVNAPPRVFLVETPKMTAVDLGCEYQLEVADDGSSWLRVQTGWVSLETREVVSVVPAGAMCRANGDGTPGLPLRRSAPEIFVEAVAQFASGSSEALPILLEHAKPGDEVTLWHLLSRVSATDRAAVYDRLVGFSSPPTNPAAILRLEEDALASWGQQLGVLPPIGWPDEGPPDPPAPVWRPNERGLP